MSLVDWFAELRAQGVTDLLDYFEKNPEQKLGAIQRIPPVDINQAVVTKLADRGSHQTHGIVTDAGLFVGQLADELGA